MRHEYFFFTHEETEFLILLYLCSKIKLLKVEHQLNFDCCNKLQFKNSYLTVILKELENKHSCTDQQQKKD